MAIGKNEKKDFLLHKSLIINIMAKIKVGINGFGRIGRLAFRAAMKRTDMEHLVSRRIIL